MFDYHVAAIVKLIERDIICLAVTDTVLHVGPTLSFHSA